MTVPPFAHAGHWIGQLAYLAPLFVLIGIAIVSKIRRRAAAGRERQEVTAHDPRWYEDPE